MKKLFIASFAAVILTGCNTTVFTAKKADGTTVSISNHRFLWASDSYTATLNTNGASLSANKSSSDSATISAIVQGAVAGAGQALKTP